MSRPLRFVVLLLAVSLFYSCETHTSVREKWFADTMEFQKTLNREFSDPKHSPLPPEAVPDFKGLEFFTPDKKYVVKAQFVRNPDPRPVEFSTSTDRKPKYIKYGSFRFKLEGKDCELSAYQGLEEPEDPAYKDMLFIPFTDKTTGVESYGGGRYLDIKIPEKDSVTLNFNLCYNPYCAYDHRWSCVIPPEENDLPVAVYAGVKAYKGEH